MALVQARPRPARLGDSLAAFVRCYGAPIREQTHLTASLRQFRSGGQTFTVLFEDDRAMAIQSDYGAPRDGVPAEQLQIGPADVGPVSAAGEAKCRLFIGDGGWAASLRACPDLFLKPLLRRI